MSAAPGANSGLPNPDRLAELLADRALVGLSDQEHAELRSLQARGASPDADADGFSSLDLAAAAADLAMFSDARGTHAEPLPAHVRDALDRAAVRFVNERGGTALPELVGRDTVGAEKQRAIGTWFAATGWLAAAAGVALAVLAWWPRLAGVRPESREAEAQRIDTLLASAGDAVRSSWAPWELNGEGPELTGVTGEVVWSDSAQAGVMRFTGLPADQGASQQYQLWIVDATRGMEQRISGGVFSAGTASDVVVPIHAPIHVNKAAAFAITIEQPGGTWVSDMKRRVVIAAVK